MFEKLSEKWKWSVSAARKKFEIEPGLYYATFADRLLASTIDTALSWLALSGLLDMISSYIYRGFDLHAFAQRMQDEVQAIAERSGGQVDLGELFSMYANVLHETGAIERITYNFGIQTVIMTAIILAFWFTRGSTPGKMVLRMRIVDAETLKEPTRSQYFIRYLGYFVSFLPFMLGFLWVGIDRRKQGWHDKMAHTLVVVDKRKPKAEEPSA